MDDTHSTPSNNTQTEERVVTQQQRGESSGDNTENNREVQAGPADGTTRKDSQQRQDSFGPPDRVMSGESWMSYATSSSVQREIDAVTSETPGGDWATDEHTQAMATHRRHALFGSIPRLPPPQRTTSGRETQGLSEGSSLWIPENSTGLGESGGPATHEGGLTDSPAPLAGARTASPEPYDSASQPGKDTNKDNKETNNRQEEK